MGQIAYVADTGMILEAFSLSNDEWDKLCSAPIGTLVMPRTNWPAIPKTSIRGLRFFAHHSGYPDKLPKPKSYAHIRLQIDIVKAARELGFQANLEVYEPNANTPNWIADVLVADKNGRSVAFEVQLSSQHLDDFIERTSRYKKSNIDVCWLISEKPVGYRLCKALCHKNISYYKETGEFLADDGDILTLNIEIPDKNTYPESLPLIRLGRGRHIKRLPLKDAIYGVMHGFPKWELPDWKWIEL